MTRDEWATVVETVALTWPTSAIARSKAIGDAWWARVDHYPISLVNATIDDLVNRGETFPASLPSLVQLLERSKGWIAPGTTMRVRPAPVTGADYEAELLREVEEYGTRHNMPQSWWDAQAKRLASVNAVGSAFDDEFERSGDVGLAMAAARRQSTGSAARGIGDLPSDPERRGAVDNSPAVSSISPPAIGPSRAVATSARAIDVAESVPGMEAIAEEWAARWVGATRGEREAMREEADTLTPELRERINQAVTRLRQAP